MSDLISKRELYKKLGEAYNQGVLTWGANEVVKDIIGECHPVENRGEWYYYANKYILMDAQRSYIRECMCKKCDGLAYFRISKITGKEIGNNFCPNCGADMRGET